MNNIINRWLNRNNNRLRLALRNRTAMAAINAIMNGIYLTNTSRTIAHMNVSRNRDNNRK